MNNPLLSEAQISTDQNVLFVFSNARDKELVENFCGTVFVATENAEVPDVVGKSVYLYGEFSEADKFETVLQQAAVVYAVREASQDSSQVSGPWRTLDPGRVPLLIHGVGIYFRNYFVDESNYFARISKEHVFQTLKESTKPGTARRTGIYLTPVERRGKELHFRLLRCSTNLSGPTENFCAVDHEIVDALNHEADSLFKNQSPLNHVLAQVYHNERDNSTGRQAKAKIKSHADKTKDMPAEGIMAFCTFYDQLESLCPIDQFDFGHKGTSGLTRLSFRLKASLAEDPECTLPREFSVTLFPNSVFLMPLSTNRLYTHEIRAGGIDVEMLPTRLGYVVRCSKAEAVHVDGETFLKSPGEVLTRLEQPTTEGMRELRRLYAMENKTDEPIDYGNRFRFSMNEGDYSAPLCKPGG